MDYATRLLYSQWVARRRHKPRTKARQNGNQCKRAVTVVMTEQDRVTARWFRARTPGMPS